MALIARKGLFDTLTHPMRQAIRFRAKINITKPRPPHHEKAKFIAVTAPRYVHPKFGKPPSELCSKGINLWKRDEVHPYERILAREVYQRISASPLIAFFHMNSTSSDVKFKVFAFCKQNGMRFQTFGGRIVELALKGTPYEAVLQLFVSRNAFVTCDQADLTTVLRIERRFPSLVLLAAVYEGVFLNRDELTKVNALGNLQTARAELVQTLNVAGSNLVQNLSAHQNTLVQNLNQRIKQLEEDSKNS